MTTFHFVRHAEKIGPDVLAGRAAGVHLSPHGRAQAEALVAWFEREPITHIFAGPLERAQETAAPLARDRGLSVEPAEALHEMDLGRFSGHTPAELAPDAEWQRFNRFRSGTRAPGGETMLEVQARIVDAVLRWREAFPGGHLVLVSHADPIRAALLYFLGLPLDHFLRLEIPPSSVSTLELGADQARIACIGWTPPVAVSALGR